MDHSVRSLCMELLVSVSRYCLLFTKKNSILDHNRQRDPAWIAQSFTISASSFAQVSASVGIQHNSIDFAQFKPNLTTTMRRGNAKMFLGTFRIIYNVLRSIAHIAHTNRFLSNAPSTSQPLHCAWALHSAQLRTQCFLRAFYGRNSSYAICTG